MAVFLLRNFDRMGPAPQMDQHFGLGLDPVDFLAPFIMPQHSEGLQRCSSSRRLSRGQRRHQDKDTTVQSNKEQFQVTLDVHQFAPEEIQVKVVDNSVVVEAKHEDKPDQHGFISRQFVRKYVLPEGHDVQQVVSTLSSDGVLIITAPKITAVEAKERAIPITQTGPHKITNDSAEQDKKKEFN